MKRTKIFAVVSAGAVTGLLVLTLVLMSGGRAAEPVTPASTPRGTLPAQVRWKADGATMVLVPAGPFPMGSTQTEAEKPRHQVNLPAYYLDLTELTYRRYLDFCARTGHQPPVTLLILKPFPEEMMDHPVGNVSWDDADAYCRFVGKRLPTEAEFEKACAGERGLVYCWGNNWDPHACTNRINSGDHTTRAGGRPSCKSPYGILDLSGNVWEWTSDWYKSYPGAPLTFDYTGQKRVARGGAFFYSIDLLRCANRYPLAPSEIADQGGFRCAVSPDPSFVEKIALP